MEVREKRIDLRLGPFACSLQGFDDPILPLTRILQELRDVQSAMPDAGRPLFDAETLRRLEGEIAALAGGDVSAMPGLVLTRGDGAEAQEEPAAAARVPTADPDPDEALAGLGAAVLAAHETEAPPADDAAGQPHAATAADGTAEGSRTDSPRVPGASPDDETDVADTVGAVARESQLSSVEGVEAPVEPEPASAVDRSAAPEAQEDSETDDDAGTANLFAAEGDEDAGPGAAANLFGDAEPAVPDDDRPSPGVYGADEEPVSTSAAAPPVDPEGENLFAAGPDTDAGTGGAVESLFGEPDAEGRETGAGAEAAIEDAAFTSPEPRAAADEAEALRPAESEAEPVATDAAPSEPAAGSAGAGDRQGEDRTANLFAPADEEEAVGINLFDDDAPEEGAGDAGAPGAAPDDETTDDGAPIAPGAFRRLDRFNPRAPVEPEEEDLPPPRSYEDISAEELAKRAKAEAPADLMAAAAAWLTVVKGHGSFTKREVLELFEALPGDHPRTAEVKVKGFGRLVRNGQVRLGDDQRFRLAEAERDRYEALLE